MKELEGRGFVTDTRAPPPRQLAAPDPQAMLWLTETAGRGCWLARTGCVSVSRGHEVHTVRGPPAPSLVPSHSCGPCSSCLDTFLR